jgi:branched-chain amino acid aminotransferase
MIEESGRVVYMNGEYVPETQAKVSIYDSALMFGDMVFEMTRSFNKTQFKLREHLERLYAGIRYVHIPLEMTIDEMEVACLATIEKNEPFFDAHDEHRLMINVSRGPLGLYSHLFGEDAKPLVIIADFPLKWTVAFMEELYDEGINAVIPNQRVIPASLMEPKVKNRSRLFYQMANIEVSKYKGKNNWPLIMDTDGFIAESSSGNFFMVKDGALYTPEPRNILRGVSRDYVFELCKELNIPCIERNLELFDVMEADEAFFTATPYCMVPATKINGLPIGESKIGPIFRQLLNEWSVRTGVDIELQIREYGKEAKEFLSNAPTPYKFSTDDEI